MPTRFRSSLCSLCVLCVFLETQSQFVFLCAPLCLRVSVLIRGSLATTETRRSTERNQN
jgi:hypothetical protein